MDLGEWLRSLGLERYEAAFRSNEINDTLLPSLTADDSLPNDGRYPALDLAPQQRRQKTLEALTAQLAGLASQQPVLMVFEDAHWTDPTSLEAFGRAVDRIKTRPALLIVTFRPEFNAPWVGQPHVMTLTLNRLGEREAVSIIERLVGKKNFRLM
jgi:predicted ATPase